MNKTIKRIYREEEMLEKDNFKLFDVKVVRCHGADKERRPVLQKSEQVPIQYYDDNASIPQCRYFGLQHVDYETFTTCYVVCNPSLESIEDTIKSEEMELGLCLYAREHGRE